jgi:PAS domain S-box-containing protein
MANEEFKIEDLHQSKAELLDQLAALQQRIDQLETDIGTPEQDKSDFRAIRICYVDAELRYRHCNDPYVNWVNQPREWILGRHVREILGEAAFKIVEKYFSRALAGETLTYEEEILYTHGGLQHIQVIYVPDIDDAGNVQGLFVSVADTARLYEAEKALEAEKKDLTERLQAEAQDFRGLEDSFHQDILNRLKAIHGARRHQQLIGDMLSNIADAVATINRHGIIETFNPSAEQMFGYSAVEAVGQNVRLLMPEPYHGEHDGYLQTYLTTGRSKILNVGSREVTAKRKDGSLFAMELSVGEMTIDDHTVFIGAMRDITERVKVDQAIRESEERYRELAELSPDGIMVHLDGKIVFANPGLARILAYDSPDELIGTEAISFAAPEEHERIREHRRRADAGERETSEEARFIRADGSETYLERVMSIVNWTGEQSYMVIFRDVNDRRNAQRLMRENEARLGLIIENIPISVAYADRSERVLFANQLFSEWTGVPLSEIIGMAFGEIQEPERYQSLKSILDKVFSGETSSVERTKQTETGETVHFTAINVPHKDEWGNVIGFFDFILDMTEHHERDDQLRQSQKMEAVGQLTGGIAHEFNNLLMVIVGNQEMTMKHLADDKVSKFSNTAMSAAMRGADLTRQLLAFSRNQDLAIERVDLNLLTKSMHELLQRTLGETIRVETRLSNDLWPATADAGQIESVLLNLSLNARDAMPNGGQITINTSNSPLTGELVSERPNVSPRDYVMLALSDNGDGMSPDILARVFDPFFTTKEVGKGTGLGLSMVHGFIEQSGGYVDIESQLGKGTVVKIYLPRSETNDAVLSADHSALIVNKNIKANILVVEDDENVRELVVQMLSELGCAVTEAEDGKQALQLLANAPKIDLIFMDVVLPGGLNGVEVADRIKQSNPAVKIVYTSGYPDGEIAKLTSNDIPTQFLRKPYLKHDLARTISQALDA